jgi:hypothetical protein
MAKAHLSEIVLPIVTDRTGNVTSPDLSTGLAGILIGRTSVYQQSVMFANGSTDIFQ